MHTLEKHQADLKLAQLEIKILPWLFSLRKLPSKGKAVFTSTNKESK